MVNVRVRLEIEKFIKSIFILKSIFFFNLNLFRIFLVSDVKTKTAAKLNDNRSHTNRTSIDNDADLYENNRNETLVNANAKKPQQQQPQQQPQQPQQQQQPQQPKQSSRHNSPQNSLLKQSSASSATPKKGINLTKGGLKRKFTRPSS